MKQDSNWYVASPEPTRNDPYLPVPVANALIKENVDEASFGEFDVQISICKSLLEHLEIEQELERNYSLIKQTEIIISKKVQLRVLLLSYSMIYIVSVILYESSESAV